MKIILEKENFLKSHIRDIIAINPLVSIRKMQELVEKNTKHAISGKYVMKLMEKIRREAVVQSDRKRLNVRLAEVRERYRVLSENLIRTIYWDWESLELYGIQKPKEKDRQSAIKLLAQMELGLLKAELAIGMFENQQQIVRTVTALKFPNGVIKKVIEGN